MYYVWQNQSIGSSFPDNATVRPGNSHRMEQISLRRTHMFRRKLTNSYERKRTHFAANNNQREPLFPAASKHSSTVNVLSIFFRKKNEFLNVYNAFGLHVKSVETAKHMMVSTMGKTLLNLWKLLVSRTHFYQIMIILRFSILIDWKKPFPLLLPLRFDIFVELYSPQPAVPLGDQKNENLRFTWARKCIGKGRVLYLSW